jgi:5-methylcytosine-specific restriction endonuclease McrA
MKSEKCLYGKHVLYRVKCPNCNAISFVIDGKCQNCREIIEKPSKLKLKRESGTWQRRVLVSRKKRAQIWESQGGVCYLCDMYIKTPYEGHIDHFVPWSYSHNNARDNLLMACSKCNGLKHDKCFISAEEARTYV